MSDAPGDEPAPLLPPTPAPPTPFAALPAWPWPYGFGSPDPAVHPASVATIPMSQEHLSDGKCMGRDEPSEARWPPRGRAVGFSRGRSPRLERRVPPYVPLRNRRSLCLLRVVSPRLCRFDPPLLEPSGRGKALPGAGAASFVVRPPSNRLATPWNQSLSERNAGPAPKNEHDA